MGKVTNYLVAGLRAKDVWRENALKISALLFHADGDNDDERQVLQRAVYVHRRLLMLRRDYGKLFIQGQVQFQNVDSRFTQKAKLASYCMVAHELLQLRQIVF